MGIENDTLHLFYTILCYIQGDFYPKICKISEGVSTI
jgi:hypothetical protein